MNILKLYQDFYNENSNFEKANFDKKLISSNFEIRGVKTSEIEKFVKFLISNNFDASSLPTNCHEDILIKGFVIGKIKDKDLKISFIRQILPYIDNWATCDMIVARLKNMKEEKEFFESLLSSDKPFYIRFGIVWLKNNCLKDDFDVIKKILTINNQDYYVKMAQSWAVADAFVIDFDKTLKVLEKINDDFIFKKSISKACESFRLNNNQKKILKALKGEKEKKC